MSSHDIPCSFCGAVGAYDQGCIQCRAPDPDSDAMSPGELRSLRQRLGLSQAVLAKRLGLPDSTISRWERGLMAISSPTVLRLALERLEASTAPPIER